MHSQFSSYRAETLQVGRKLPGTSRRGVTNFGDIPGFPGGIHIIFERCKGSGNPASLL